MNSILNNIYSEITRLNGAKSALEISIESKGVDIPDEITLNEYSLYVDEISSGSDGLTFDDVIMKDFSEAYGNATKIGDYVFMNCSNLTTVSFPNCATIGTSAFHTCDKLTSVNFPECTYIGSSAFYYCTSLATISFPKCKTIGEGAFIRCSALTEANFPECTYIGSLAFSHCFSLTTASFPVCKTISNSAFYVCESLTSVSFPNCSTIRSNAFNCCYNLKSLYLTGSSICNLSNSNAFSSTPIAGYTTSTNGVYGSIYVPASLLTQYQSAANWSYYSSRFVGV